MRIYAGLFRFLDSLTVSGLEGGDIHEIGRKSDRLGCESDETGRKSDRWMGI